MPIEITITAEEITTALVFLADGKSLISGGLKGKLQQWRVEDGKEIGKSMNLNGSIANIAISRDGKWIASTTESGLVSLWNSTTYTKAKEIKAHGEAAVVDFSPDGSKIVTASNDKTVSVWAVSTGQQLLGPLKHDNDVLTARFSQDGKFIAAATHEKSIRIYDSLNGRRLTEFSVQIAVSSVAKWRVHNEADIRPEPDDPSLVSITLARHDAFIVVSSLQLVSFWDPMTHQQIGSVVNYPHGILGTAVVSESHLATGGEKITLRRLSEILPLPYLDKMRGDRDAESTTRPSTEPAPQGAQQARASDRIAELERQVEELRNRLAAAQVSAGQEHTPNHTTHNNERDNSSGNGPHPYANVPRQNMSAASEIRKVINETLSDIPHVLINVNTGRLNHRSDQIAAFETQSVYATLLSSPDRERIRREVEGFYRYAMFSHRWDLQGLEPTFRMLQNTPIDALAKSPGNDKLRGFRNIVRSHRLLWLWSDTCCVNQDDNGVVQESVVAMFRWYRRSTLTVIHLLGVLSNSQNPTYLWNSIWNGRGWTYQEYVASPVVQFYTEDWKPYCGLTLWNHKDSPIIRSEMARAMNFAENNLITLQPGLDRVREKLYLASRRDTTRPEDIAYCLFGIFGISSISVNYGEGREAAVSRLLEHILTRSADITLLSWTGNSSRGHLSFLPSNLVAYSRIESPHIPRPISMEEMNNRVTSLRSSPANVALAVELYELLRRHWKLSFDTGDLRLFGLIFPITHLTPVSRPTSSSGLHTYHATASVLGVVQIETNDDLMRMTDLRLVHPWIYPLLREDFSGATTAFNSATLALRLVVRLRQRFGALLLASVDYMRYKRVATEKVITAQIQEGTTLSELKDGFCGEIHIR